MIENCTVVKNQPIAPSLPNNPSAQSKDQLASSQGIRHHDADAPAGIELESTLRTLCRKGAEFTKLLGGVSAVVLVATHGPAFLAPAVALCSAVWMLSNLIEKYVLSPQAEKEANGIVEGQEVEHDIGLTEDDTGITFDILEEFGSERLRRKESIDSIGTLVNLEEEDEIPKNGKTVEEFTIKIAELIEQGNSALRSEVNLNDLNEEELPQEIFPPLGAVKCGFNRKISAVRRASEEIIKEINDAMKNSNLFEDSSIISEEIGFIDQNRSILFEKI